MPFLMAGGAFRVSALFGCMNCASAFVAFVLRTLAWVMSQLFATLIVTTTTYDDSAVCYFLFHLFTSVATEITEEL